MKRALALILCAAGAQAAGPTVDKTSLNFSYEANSTTLPAAAKITATLPASMVTQALQAQVTTVPADGRWLTVTPDSGYSPLSLTVTVNPTGKAPGSYPGKIVVDTKSGSGSPVTVNVTLSVTNPPSNLKVGSNSANWAASSTGANSGSLTFLYTTGDSDVTPTKSVLDIVSSGDTIPFNVATAVTSVKGSGASANWLRVKPSNTTGQPAATTSGVAFSGSSFGVEVTLDSTTVKTLDPGSYAGQITVTPTTSTKNGASIVLVNLVISAGAPTLATIPLFPPSVVAGPTVDPVITIYGDNFFATSVVTLKLHGSTNTPMTLNYGATGKPLLLSRGVLQVTIDAADLAYNVANTYPMAYDLSVTNPAPPDDPSQGPVTTTFHVTSPTLPGITNVMNAASFLPTSTFTGIGGTNPVAAGLTSVAPREIISIFGANLGPGTPSPTKPSTATPSTYPLITDDGIRVAFEYGPSGTRLTVYAPIIIAASNQINCVVPRDILRVVGTADAGTVTAQVLTASGQTQKYPLFAVPSDPGVFTFGGLGQGQGAILNNDSSGVTVNASKTAAARGSTVSVYVTGMGILTGDDLASPTIADGEVVSWATWVNDHTVRVDIDGQPAVVTYAGATPGAIAGLIQVNAVVPPTVRTGAAIPLTVSIGSKQMSRRSQANVTIAVK